MTAKKLDLGSYPNGKVHIIGKNNNSEYSLHKKSACGTAFFYFNNRNVCRKGTMEEVTCLSCRKAYGAEVVGQRDILRMCYDFIERMLDSETMSDFMRERADDIISHMEKLKWLKRS